MWHQCASAPYAAASWGSLVAGAMPGLLRVRWQCWAACRLAAADARAPDLTNGTSAALWSRPALLMLPSLLPGNGCTLC